jgi:hypothetical protein
MGENTEGNEVDSTSTLFSIPLDGFKVVSIGLWIFLLAVIIIGAIGDLLRWDLLLNIASIGAMTLIVVACALLLVVLCFALVYFVSAIFGKITK